MNTYEQIKSNKIKTAVLVALFPILLLCVSWVIFHFYLKGLYAEAAAYAGGNTIISNLKSIDLSFFYTLLDTPFEISFINGFALVFLWVVIFCFVMFTISYFFGGRLLLYICGAGGSRLIREDDPRVFCTVENMARTVGVTMPYIYVVVDQSPNILTVGTGPADASIIMTQGLIDQLDNAEMEAVVCHEIAHIMNGDLLLMNTVNTFIYGIVVLGRILPFSKLRFLGYFYTFIVGFILFVYGTITAPLIKLALSKRREMQADAQAALISRNPRALINALEKMDKAGTVIEAFEDDPLLSDLCILSACKKDQMDLFVRVFNWFDAHPDLEERIEALNQMDGRAAA